jgi:hypothetical protein
MIKKSKHQSKQINSYKKDANSTLWKILRSMKDLQNKRPKNRNQIFKETNSENNYLKNINKNLQKESSHLKKQNNVLRKEIRILKLQLRMAIIETLQ